MKIISKYIIFYHLIRTIKVNISNENMVRESHVHWTRTARKTYWILPILNPLEMSRYCYYHLNILLCVLRSKFKSIGSIILNIIYYWTYINNKYLYVPILYTYLYKICIVHYTYSSLRQIARILFCPVRLKPLYKPGYFFGNCFLSFYDRQGIKIAILW